VVISQRSIFTKMTTPLANPEEYDLVVLGSGEVGNYLAWTLARKGQRAVVVERTLAAMSLALGDIAAEATKATIP
jgi:flavin-dependent dehydrogenase